LKEARTFADLDRRRSEAIANDPVKEGMWKMGDKIGVISGDFEKAWERSWQKFCAPLTTEDLVRFDKIVKRK
jgi:hypothetical protein